MNIFFLDKNPEVCAEMHCDKHVVKMILETAQLLSTAHRVLDGVEYTEKTKSNRNIKRYKLNDFREDSLYKATHINHPSSVWVRQSASNYVWLYDLFINLCAEYTFRYGKIHATQTKLISDLANIPNNLPDIGMTLMPQAMPEYCKDSDPVVGYRNYYKLEKSSMLNYTKRGKPLWI